MKRRRGEASRQVLYGRVGNGGLSLRRVEAFRRACATYRTEAENYLADPCHLHNEDVFWAVVPREFRYPAPDEALRFSVDTHPAYALRRLDGSLPFGCHKLDETPHAAGVAGDHPRREVIRARGYSCTSLTSVVVSGSG